VIEPRFFHAAIRITTPPFLQTVEVARQSALAPEVDMLAVQREIVADACRRSPTSAARDRSYASAAIEPCGQPNCPESWPLPPNVRMNSRLETPCECATRCAADPLKCAAISFYIDLSFRVIQQ
jgi:hypothetical protein